MKRTKETSLGLQSGSTIEDNSIFAHNINGMDALEYPERKFHAFVGRRRSNQQSEILKRFSPQEQQDIKYRQHILSSLAYFIGKDFSIPVKLSEPGSGWYWDFQKNEIKIDPKDLIDKPMDFLRFVISHEGSHRRISRAEFIPLDIWRQPGFSAMANMIEDPRVDNFLAEAYPKSREQIKLAYDMAAQFAEQVKKEAKDRMGFKPRFISASFEYMKQWFGEIQGQPMEPTADLALEVKEFIEKTLESARDAWWRYPSKQEADQSEELIKRYAQVVYEIERDEIWPEFKKLVDQDIQDEKIQEMLGQMMQQQDLQQEPGEGDQEGKSIPQDLKDQLSDQEQQQLQQAMQEALQKSQGKNQQQEEQNQRQSEGEQAQAAEGQSVHEQKRTLVDLDSLSAELKQKLKDYMDKQPQPVQQQLEEIALKVLKEFEDMINEMIQGKLSDDPEKRLERKKRQEAKQKAQSKKQTEIKEGEKKPLDEEIDPGDKRVLATEYEKSEEFKKFKEELEQALQKDQGVYEEKRKEVMSIIDALEQDLRELFMARRARRWDSGFKSGKRIDIKKRMQEKALGITAVESKAWQKRELPQEKDYAITLLVDLSGSMHGEKIEETFKGAIVLAEVLNRLSIKTEILGFNDRLYEYQVFGQDMSHEVRDQMGEMLIEVDSSRAKWNDDGWALKKASERLAKQRASEKFLFVLSDGSPAESFEHEGPQYELEKVVGEIMSTTDQKLIGLGIGPGTDHVAYYYPNSVADIAVTEMPDKLADVIREVIVNYGSF